MFIETKTSALDGHDVQRMPLINQGLDLPRREILPNLDLQRIHRFFHVIGMLGIAVDYGPLAIEPGIEMLRDGNGDGLILLKFLVSHCVRVFS